MDIKIEKNIPLAPLVTGQKKSRWKNVLSKMAIGDSFVITKDSKARNAIFNAARNWGMKVATRKISDDEIRVWRTE